MTSIPGVTTIPNNAASSFLNPTAAAVVDTSKQVLDVDDFLKLITVQLTTQDPLKPMEDTQFISQMASFTSLEQMQTLSKDFKTFTADQVALSAQQYLGKTVTVATDAGNITGPVTKVSFMDGTPLLSVNGGDFYLADVISVSATTTPSPSSNSTAPAEPPASTN